MVDIAQRIRSLFASLVHTRANVRFGIWRARRRRRSWLGTRTLLCAWRTSPATPTLSRSDPTKHRSCDSRTLCSHSSPSCFIFTSFAIALAMHSHSLLAPFDAHIYRTCEVWRARRRRRSSLVTRTRLCGVPPPTRPTLSRSDPKSTLSRFTHPLFICISLCFIFFAFVIARPIALPLTVDTVGCKFLS